VTTEVDACERHAAVPEYDMRLRIEWSSHLELVSADESHRTDLAQ
jgi:hypothetical protein